MYSVNPAKYSGIAPTISLLLKEEGSIDIPKGFGPTFVGYSLQGMFKYGLYKVFKDAYMKIAGPKLTEDYKGLNLVRCAASAEVVAYLALCPLEMTKVKIQTASPSGSFPTALGAALREMKTKRQRRGIRLDPSSRFGRVR